MSDIEKNLYRFLLIVAGVAISIGAVAGPLGHTAVSIAASGAAILIALCLVVYGLYFWAFRK